MLLIGRSPWVCGDITQEKEQHFCTRLHRVKLKRRELNNGKSRKRWISVTNLATLQLAPSRLTVDKVKPETFVAQRHRQLLRLTANGIVLACRATVSILSKRRNAAGPRLWQSVA